MGEHGKDQEVPAVLIQGGVVAVGPPGHGAAAPGGGDAGGDRRVDALGAAPEQQQVLRTALFIDQHDDGLGAEGQGPLVFLPHLAVPLIGEGLDGAVALGGDGGIGGGSVLGNLGLEGVQGGLVAVQGRVEGGKGVVEVVHQDAVGFHPLGQLIILGIVHVEDSFLLSNFVTTSFRAPLRCAAERRARRGALSQTGGEPPV